ncbi:MAG: hypothetical protein ABIA04_06705 [Pseudomonadota bacterium]
MILKFGGACLGHVEYYKNILHIITQRKAKCLIIVVSAIGKTTRMLAFLCEEAERSKENYTAHNALIDFIELNKKFIQNLFACHETTEKLELIFKPYYNRMKEILSFISETSDASNILKDEFFSFGELISSNIFNEFLLKNNLNPVLLDARKIIITDSNFGAANPCISTTKENLKSEIAPFRKENHIFIIQGFIGANVNNDTTTLGFEGSDYTATLLGSIINASKVELWKNVKGICECDPDLNPAATTIRQIGYKDAIEFAESGAKILHPKSIIPAMENNIEVVINDIKCPDEVQTVISRKS